MCAKHTLWLHDEGGVQADFSGCELSNLDLSHRDLNNALFNGAFLYGTSFQESYLCFADFSDAEIENCNAKNIAADEAVFKTRSSAIVISAVHLWNTVTFPVQI